AIAGALSLGVGQVDFAPRGLFDTGILHVRHDAHDRAPGVGERGPDAAPNRALVVPEYARHGLVHDSDIRRAGAVAIVEEAALDEPYARRFEIPFAHNLVVIHVLVRTAPLAHEPLDLRVVGVQRARRRQTRHERGRLH